MSDNTYDKFCAAYNSRSGQDVFSFRFTLPTARNAQSIRHPPENHFLKDSPTAFKMADHYTYGFATYPPSESGDSYGSDHSDPEREHEEQMERVHFNNIYDNGALEQRTEAANHRNQPLPPRRVYRAEPETPPTRQDAMQVEPSPESESPHMYMHTPGPSPSDQSQAGGIYYQLETLDRQRIFGDDETTPNSDQRRRLAQYLKEQAFAQYQELACREAERQLLAEAWAENERIENEESRREAQIAVGEHLHQRTWQAIHENAAEAEKIDVRGPQTLADWFPDAPDGV